MGIAVKHAVRAVVFWLAAAGTAAGEDTLAGLIQAGDRDAALEMIVAGAAKCRFCGEIFDSRLRQQELNSVTPDAAKNLSAGDWVVAVVCEEF